MIPKLLSGLLKKTDSNQSNENGCFAPPQFSFGRRVITIRKEHLLRSESSSPVRSHPLYYWTAVPMILTLSYDGRRRIGIISVSSSWNGGGRSTSCVLPSTTNSTTRSHYHSSLSTFLVLCQSRSMIRGSGLVV